MSQLLLVAENLTFDKSGKSMSHLLSYTWRVSAVYDSFLYPLLRTDQPKFAYNLETISFSLLDILPSHINKL